MKFNGVKEFIFVLLILNITAAYKIDDSNINQMKINYDLLHKNEKDNYHRLNSRSVDVKETALNKHIRKLSIRQSRAISNILQATKTDEAIPTEKANKQQDEIIEAQNCPKSCSKKGYCVNGNCYCRPGYAGDDCSISTIPLPDCPNNCSKNGKCLDGNCICISGWGGFDCSISK